MNSQGLYTLLAWQRGAPGGPHTEPPLQSFDEAEDGTFRLALAQSPNVGNHDSGGTPNYPDFMKWIRAIEVLPLPAGMTPIDPLTIPAGVVVVYGNIRDTNTASAFYFAEGTCRPGFDPYICIQNPNPNKAAVTITYMLGDKSTDSQTLNVDAYSRKTVNVKDKLGEGNDDAHDFSAKVECTNGQTIIAERRMYFNYKGEWTGGHDVMGFIPQ